MRFVSNTFYFFVKDRCFYRLSDELILRTRCLSKTHITPSSPLKSSKNFLFWRRFTPKATMLYMFPALLTILKDLFLIPGISGSYSGRVSGLRGLRGLLAACILPQEQLETGLSALWVVRAGGTWFCQVGNQPVRKRQGNMISLLTSLNENVCNTAFPLLAVSAVAKQASVSRAEWNAMCTRSRRTFQKASGLPPPCDLVDFMCKAFFCYFSPPFVDNPQVHK